MKTTWLAKHMWCQFALLFDQWCIPAERGPLVASEASQSQELRLRPLHMASPIFRPDLAHDSQYLSWQLNLTPFHAGLVNYSVIMWQFSSYRLCVLPMMLCAVLAVLQTVVKMKVLAWPILPACILLQGAVLQAMSMAMWYYVVIGQCLLPGSCRWYVSPVPVPIARRKSWRGASLLMFIRTSMGSPYHVNITVLFLYSNLMQIWSLCYAFWTSHVTLQFWSTLVCGHVQVDWDRLGFCSAVNEIFYYTFAMCQWLFFVLLLAGLQHLQLAHVSVLQGELCCLTV